MKIAVVAPLMVAIPPPKYGGIEQIVTELVEGLSSHGHQISVYCAGQSTINNHNVTKIESSPFPTSTKLSENRHFEIKQLLTVLKRQNEYDLIHFHYEPMGLKMTIDQTEINLLDWFTTPVALTFHNTTNLTDKIAYYERAESIRRHTAIFISQNQKGRLPFYTNSTVIYNGISVEKFPLQTTKQEYLLFLGRITKVKGILEAIKVAKMVNIPLIIVAKIDPVDQQFFDDEVKDQIDGRLIQYAGEANFEQKIRYLASAKALLFPILWEEPFGLVMVEALACGTPVIAFPNGSVPEIIENDKNGYLVNDVTEMAAAVSKLNRIDSINCRRRVEENFTASLMVKRYESLFTEMVKRSKD